MIFIHFSDIHKLCENPERAHPPLGHGGLRGCRESCQQLKVKLRVKFKFPSLLPFFDLGFPSMAGK